MQAASSFAFLKKKPAPAPNANAMFGGMPGGQYLAQMDAPDTNVISVHFDTLKQAEENLQMGDPFFCKHCRSCLSSASDICTKAEYEVKLETMKKENSQNQKEEEKKEEEPEANKEKIITTAIGDNDKVWICEFCGTHNLLNLDQEEIPKTDDVIYLIKSAEQINKNPLDLESDITTIFCIDNSGSMSVSQEVSGKHNIKHGITEEEYEMLKQFIEYGADQYLPNQKKDTTFITRKQCVLAAIENQLLEMKNEFPNRKVGLVAFDSDVNVVGDGKNPPEIITGDKLYKYDVLRQIGENGSQTLITSPVKVSAESLLKKFESLKESGKTALGPALLVSIGLAAQGKQGSRVLLCTDGLANIGLGEMDTPGSIEKAEEFYTDIATFAKEKGVSVSVISIKGEGCKLDVIGKLADLTSGSLMRVDPNEITTKFANAMKDEVIGTQVDVKLRLHRGLKFRNALEELLRERGSLFEKSVGNVTAQTELTFEYETRPDNELMEFGVDLAKLQSVPFQAQIIYTSTNGDKLMRVITKKLKTTEKQEEAEKHMRMEVMATRALQHQAEVAHHGHYGYSQQVGQAWGDYFNNQMATGEHKHQEKVVNFYQQKNIKMQEVAMKKQDKVASKPMPQMQSQPQPNQPAGLFDRVAGFFKKPDAKDKKEVAEEEEDDDAYEALHEGKNFNKHKFL